MYGFSPRRHRATGVWIVGLGLLTTAITGCTNADGQQVTAELASDTAVEAPTSTISAPAGAEQPSEPTLDPPPSTTMPTTPPTTTPPPSVVPVSSAPSDCATKPSGIMTFATEKDFITAISGQWFLCATPSVFGTSDEIGLEITVEHRWRKLYGSPDTVEPGVGWDLEGSWTAMDMAIMNTPGVFSLNFDVDGGGMYPMTPIISSSGDYMRLSSSSFPRGDYVRRSRMGATPASIVSVTSTTAATLASYSPTIIPVANPPADCAVARSDLKTYTSKEQVAATITGRWLLCTTPSVFGTSNDIGLEITSDHRWRKLYGSRDAAVTIPTWDSEGSWDVLVLQQQDQPDRYQLNLTIDGQGTVFTAPQIAARGNRMWLPNNGVFTGDYVRS
jgi:hypothetical protein